MKRPNIEKGYWKEVKLLKDKPSAHVRDWEQYHKDVEKYIDYLESKEQSGNVLPTETKEFLSYIKEERDIFCRTINFMKHPDNKLRTDAESLLIAYDQMAERLKSTPPKELTEEMINDLEQKMYDEIFHLFKTNDVEKRMQNDDTQIGAEWCFKFIMGKLRDYQAPKENNAIQLLRKILNIRDLIEYGGDVEPEHENEADTLSEMMKEVEAIVGEAPKEEEHTQNQEK